MKFKLHRTKQCAKCPWRISTNPNEIPHGYCELKHANLSSTIAKPGDLSNLYAKTMNIMVCHHSKYGQEEHCIGWLHNQLGIGNNIPLRIQMMQCENIGNIKVVGEQHEKFENTLPKI